MIVRLAIEFLIRRYDGLPEGKRVDAVKLVPGLSRYLLVDIE